VFTVVIKVKANFTLEQAMKTQRGSTGIKRFLTPALHRDKWLKPRPSRFTLWKQTRYLLYRRLGGPQGQSGRVRKIPHRDSIPGPSSPKNFAIPSTLVKTIKEIRKKKLAHPVAYIIIRLVRIQVLLETYSLVANT
jgi:hypothetical protein